MFKIPYTIFIIQLARSSEMKKLFPFIICLFTVLLFPIGIHKIYGTSIEATKIAILDTTAYLDHPDLKPHIVGGYNFVLNQPIDFNEVPSSFHGTHITGIICGTEKNKGIYPDAQILYYVVDAPHTGTYHENVTKAIYRALQDGAKVINFSGKLSYNFTDTHILQAIAYARQNGVIFVKSCGNNGPNLWTTGDLAVSDQVISVGAYNPADSTIYELSSRGPAFGSLKIKPDLVAPGVNIMSAAPATQGNYIEASGTSMSAAFVSGALGLLKANRPELSTELLIGSLLNNATPLTHTTGKAYSVLEQGCGALNLTQSIATDLVCLPSQLSFSYIPPLEASLIQTSKLYLKNTKATDISYSLTFVPEDSQAPFQVTFPTQVTLKPYEEKLISFTLQVDPNAPPNHYGGRLYLKNETSTKNLPFLLEIPGNDFPLIRGFSLSQKIVSFCRPTDFRFILEASLPSTLAVWATNMTTNTTYTLFEGKALHAGINEIGWDGYATDKRLLPDGLYEITSTASSGTLSTSTTDVMLLIDNTPPLFKEVEFSQDASTSTLTITLSDLMIPYSYVVDIVYREYEQLPAPLSVSYSFDNEEYFPFSLPANVDQITFNIPNKHEKIYLRAKDLSGNTLTRCFLIPYTKD